MEKFSGDIPRRDSESSQEFESRINLVHAWGEAGSREISQPEKHLIQTVPWNWVSEES